MKDFGDRKSKIDKKITGNTTKPAVPTYAGIKFESPYPSNKTKILMMLSADTNNATIMNSKC